MKKTYETPDAEIVRFTSLNSIMQESNNGDGDKIYGNGMSDQDIGGDLPTVTGPDAPWL